MIGKAAAALGRLCLLGVALTFIIGATLLLFGSYLLTWPVMRKSPRNKRIKASVDLASAALVWMQAFGDNLPLGGDNATAPQGYYTQPAESGEADTSVGE